MAPNPATPLAVPTLAVNDLRISTTAGVPIVRDVSFTVNRHELLGLIGESGSGKTTTALACLAYARPGLEVTGGTVRIHETDLLSLAEADARSLRGRLVAYVPQEPALSLNPSFRVEQHLIEALRTSGGPDKPVELLERVWLPTTRDFLRRYPHQLSGGQQQRVAIAMALAGGAEVMILDEPTTGVDTVTKRALLREISQICRGGLSAVVVSHDLASIADIADRVAVMYDGSIVEEGPVDAVITTPRHPYTAALVVAIPDVRGDLRPTGELNASEPPAASGCAFRPRCTHSRPRCADESPPPTRCDIQTVRCLFPLDASDHDKRQVIERRPPGVDEYPALEVDGLSAGHARTTIVHDVSFAVGSGEFVALVGESGSGKTTIARCIVGLHRPSSGVISLCGEPVAPVARSRPRSVRSAIQIVFQNPNSSLNPRITVGEAIARPASLLRGISGTDLEREVSQRLTEVRLAASMADRLPFELSGGERQRVAIAAALAARPVVLVCDEMTSSLDVSVQASILDLLVEIRRELQLALLFITHDLGVVNALADRTIVLEAGRIQEQGPTDQVLRRPTAPYTRLLLDAAAHHPAGTALQR